MTVGHAPGRCDLPGAHVAGSETGDADPDHVAAGVVGERTEVAMAGVPLEILVFCKELT